MAFERLLADAPDAIVVDMVTGGTDQITDCWRLHDLLNVPLIVLAEGMVSDQAVALLERGAADVVTEPPDDALLAARVAAVLRRVRRRTMDVAPPVLQLDGVEVDMARRTVHRLDGSQSLSRTEFNLLLALLRAGGRACTHAELVTRIWGTDSASATHYLRLYIRYLRQKIERNPLEPRHILNVRGVGYRLVLNPAGSRQTELPDVPAASSVSSGQGDPVRQTRVLVTTCMQRELECTK